MHTCEELVPIPHAREKSHRLFTDVTNTYQIFTRKNFFITKYRNWPYVELTFDKSDLVM